MPLAAQIITASLKKLRLLRHCAVFGKDYLLCLIDDRHTSSPSSYFLIRKLYSFTKGKSSSVLAIPFQLLNPIRQKSSNHEINHIVRHLHKYGCYKLEPNETAYSLALNLQQKLSQLPVQENGSKLIHRDIASALSSPHRLTPRLMHDSNDVCRMKETWGLIKELRLTEVASTYLGCEPILTDIQSWHVVPIENHPGNADIYSAAAQTFHYDMDWLKFIKIFINLSDATAGSGPFEFALLSHIKKPDYFYNDCRFETIFNDSQIAYATGKPGSSFFADTSGLHRDGRAIDACRHVLQIEFSVSSFGAKFQFDKTYKKCSVNALGQKHLFKDADRMFKLFER